MAEKKAASRQVTSTVYEWPIKENHCFFEKGVVSSNSIFAFNAIYKMDYHPAGRQSADEGYSSLFIKKLAEKFPFSPPLKLSLSIEIGDYVVESKVMKNVFGEKFLGPCGFLNFCKRSKLFKFLRPVNDWSIKKEPSNSSDTIKIVCTFCDFACERKSTATQAISLIDGRSIRERNFEDLYHSGKNSDVIIKFRSKTFSLHQAILAVQSSYFSSLLESWRAENIDGVIDITDDIDCDPETFEFVTRFIYTGNLDHNSVSMEEVYLVADKLKMDGLKEIVCKILSENLNLENVTSVLQLALSQKETDLREAAIRFFITNAAQMFVNEKWRKLLKEKPDVASEILSFVSSRSDISLKNKDS